MFGFTTCPQSRIRWAWVDVPDPVPQVTTSHRRSKQTWLPGLGVLGTGSQYKYDLDEASLLKHTCSWSTDAKIGWFGKAAGFQTYSGSDCFWESSFIMFNLNLSSQNHRRVDSGSTNSGLEARSDQVEGWRDEIMLLPWQQQLRLWLALNQPVNSFKTGNTTIYGVRVIELQIKLL